MSVRKKFEKLTLNPDYNGAEAPDENKKSPDSVQADAENEQHDANRSVYAFRRATPAVGESGKVYTVGFVQVYVVFLVSFALAAVNRFLTDAGVYVSLSGVSALAVSIAADAIIFFLPPMIYALLRKNERGMLLGFRRFSTAHLPFILLSFVLMIACIAVIQFSLAYFFSITDVSAVPRSVRGENAGYMLLLYAILPAIFEEILLRGILQNGIAEKAGGFAGIAVSAVASALLHLNLHTFLIHFAAGLFLAVTAHVCASVLPGMVMHAALNVLSLSFSVQLTFIASERAGNTFVLVILILVLFLLLLFWLKSLELLCSKKALSAELQLLDTADEPSKSGDSPKNKAKKQAREDAVSRIRFYAPPRRFGSDTGYTLHKFLRVFFSPALIVAAVLFLFIVL